MLFAVCELLYALDFLVTIEMLGLYGGCFVVGGLGLLFWCLGVIDLFCCRWLWCCHLPGITLLRLLVDLGFGL